MVSKEHGSIHEGFDDFITGKIKDGTFYFDMSRTDLKEELRRLGIRRVRFFDSETGKGYTENAYPKPRQLDYVESFIKNAEPTQKKIDKSDSYEENREHHYFRSKDIIFYKGKTYRKGQFLPKGYIYEY